VDGFWIDKFAGLTDQEIVNTLDLIFGNPVRQVVWHLIFMSMIVGIVLCGVRQGIERWNFLLMPALFLLLLSLLCYALFLPGIVDAIIFLFRWDTSSLTRAGVLEAVGHSFFTLSLGMGAMLTYGSYLAKKEKLVSTAIKIAFLDTLIALIVSVVIFSVVFSSVVEAGSGPTLMFQSLPIIFNKMPGGYFVSIAFFMLVAFAAITAAVSLLEVVVSYWVETKKMSRIKVTICAGISIFCFGLLSALSTNLLSNFRIIGMSIFDFLDKITSSVTLPLAGLLISVLGWVMGKKAVFSIFSNVPIGRFAALIFLWGIRVVAPVAIYVILLQGILGW